MSPSGLVTVMAAIINMCYCQGDTNVSDYIRWQKEDIALWDQYFPRRILKQELLIATAAVAAVNNISSGINSSLRCEVMFQQQELQTAEQLMAGTEAEGCVAGIADYMSTSIDREISTYSDCTADALPNIIRLNRTLDNLRSRYEAAYQRALKGIDACAKIYPNKDSMDRLRACVLAMTNSYFTVSNDTIKALSPSPAMSYFTQTVVECASTAAVNVADDGWQFLKLLLYCASLSGNINMTTYAEELNQWEGYNDTLSSQVSDAQTKSLNQILIVKNEIQSYFNLQRQVLAKYVIESRDFSYYQNKTHVYLNDYYASVNETLFDNPYNTTCALNAEEELDNIVKQGANESLGCDVAIVNDTTRVINQINDNYLLLNQLMPEAGDVAILNCFASGFVFAPNTIDLCFQLVYSEFKVDHDDLHKAIQQDTSTLSSYLDAIFNSSWLPCGSNLQRDLLAADRTLYKLQRCLYEEYGTNYQVTTPRPSSLFTTGSTDIITYTDYESRSTLKSFTQKPTTSATPFTFKPQPPWYNSMFLKVFQLVGKVIFL